MTSPEQAVAALQVLRDGERHLDEVVRLGAAVVPALEDALRVPSSLYQPRVRVVEALTRISSPLAAEALHRAFLASVHAQEALEPVLREAERVVFDHLARALGRRVPGAPALLRAALRRHPSVGCIEALAELRDLSALPLIARALLDDFARDAAASALNQFGPLAASPLVQVLLSSETRPSAVAGRAAAARLLARLGGDEADLPLVWALHDESQSVRIASALGLYVRHGARIAELLWSSLLEGLASEDLAEQEEVVGVLCNLPAPGESLLLELTRGESAAVRTRCLGNLARVLVRHPDRIERCFEVLLGHLEVDGQLALLRPLLRFEMGSLLPPLFEQLLPAAQEELLRRARGSPAMPLLISLALDSRAPEVRREARRVRRGDWLHALGRGAR